MTTVFELIAVWFLLVARNAWLCHLRDEALARRQRERERLRRELLALGPLDVATDRFLRHIEQSFNVMAVAASKMHDALAAVGPSLDALLDSYRCFGATPEDELRLAWATFVDPIREIGETRWRTTACHLRTAWRLCYAGVVR